MDVEHVINAAIVSILREYTFYGHIICQLPKIYTTSIETMAVGKRGEGVLISLMINPEYIEKKYQEAGKDKAFAHIKEIIKHEILHIVFKHLFLDYSKKSNRTKLDMACECSVNSYINRSVLLDKGVFPEDFGLEKELGVEEYYNLLPDFPEQQIKISFSMGKGNDGESKSESGNGNGEENIQIQISTLDSHGEWKDVEKDKVSNIVLEDIIRKAKEAAVMAGNWGSTPSTIRGLVDSFLEREEEKICWETALRDFISSSSETILDYTNKKVSKRFGTRPSTKKEDKLRLAIGIDTSGSIDNQTLSMFFSELYWISKQNVEITVFECDCQIGKVYPFSDWDETEPISGGGGTDLEPVISRASEEGYDALIYFTDAYAPKIETDYNIPVLMVIPEMFEGMSHSHMNDLPYPCKMVFYVNKKGEVSVN